MLQKPADSPEASKSPYSTLTPGSDLGMCSSICCTRLAKSAGEYESIPIPGHAAQVKNPLIFLLVVLLTAMRGVQGENDEQNTKRSGGVHDEEQHHTLYGWTVKGSTYFSRADSALAISFCTTANWSQC